ncbi:MAG: ABC transporter permease subunit [Melioribacteraceae bacterium]
MKILLKIIKYQLHDLSRSKWIIIYTTFFFLLSYSLFTFNKDFSRVLISLMNVVLIIIPLVSTIFGTIHYYNSKEYIIFMLSQPIKRSTLFFGLYIGLALPLALSFVVGTSIPILFNLGNIHGDFDVLIFLFIAGFFQTIIFCSIAFLIATLNENKMLGLGLATFSWLAFSAIYDALILFLLQILQDYPIEKISIILSMLNPIDLARLLVILKLDISALMGYTGAVFQKFFGSSLGTILSILSLIVWAVIPFFIGIKNFSKKDF